MEQAHNVSKLMVENYYFLHENIHKKSTSPRVISFGDGFDQKAKILVGMLWCLLW